MDKIFYTDLTECNINYYTNNYDNFENWFLLVKNMEDVYPFCKIPYRQWVDEYIGDIKNKSVYEVKELIRCLLRPFSRPLDTQNYKITKFSIEKCGLDENIILENEHYMRIRDGFYAWEGLTWIVGLLPNKPYEAINGLQSYIRAENMSLPDDRIIGIEQCIEIIIAKFIEFEVGIEELLKLKPREFEFLINELYKSMGYKTKLTKATRDGGKDIVAEINRFDRIERVYIECKLYDKTKLNIKDVAYLANTVLNDKINSGVIFCTGYVSDNLREYDRRIHIVNFNEINMLLNAFLGLNWVNNLENIISRNMLEERGYGDN
ncbi:restriction endonuclease [Clostridium perfringens]|nr:restriction endonuclease [Clostridium perfringens]